MPARQLPAVAITIGDWNGIGPEVALKACAGGALDRVCTPLLVGPMSGFAFYARRLGLARTLVPWRERRSAGAGKGPRVLEVIEPAGRMEVRISPGTVSRDAGKGASGAIVEGVRLVRAGFAVALVTSPVSKTAMHRAGVRYPGQTELLQHLTGSGPVAMILESRTMRIGLATIHLPLREVPGMLSQRLLRERIGVIDSALRRDWRISHPRMAVLGLNPHAGEDGALGDEERSVISPVVTRLRDSGMDIDGPVPADGFFGTGLWKSYDIIVAMYHDQGLIPLKLSGFRSGVNITAGLPIIRTSPDHGTAFDLAGSGTADPASMVSAVTLAVRLAANRARTTLV